MRNILPVRVYYDQNLMIKKRLVSVSNVEPESLYIVATPIGNLADMSARAIEVLKDVDVIAAEDTRHSGHLLQHYAIKTPTVSLHEHNEQQRSEVLLSRLQAGEAIASQKPLFPEATKKVMPADTALAMAVA